MVTNACGAGSPASYCDGKHWWYSSGEAGGGVDGGDDGGGGVGGGGDGGGVVCRISTEMPDGGGAGGGADESMHMQPSTLPPTLQGCPAPCRLKMSRSPVKVSWR